MVMTYLRVGSKCQSWLARIGLKFEKIKAKKKINIKDKESQIGALGTYPASRPILLDVYLWFLRY